MSKRVANRKGKGRISIKLWYKEISDKFGLNSRLLSRVAFGQSKQARIKTPNHRKSSNAARFLRHQAPPKVRYVSSRHR